MRIKNALMITLIVIATIIATQNTHTVGLKILLWELALPFIVFIALILAMGLAIGYLLGGTGWPGKRKGPG